MNRRARARRTLQLAAFALLYRLGGRLYDRLSTLIFGDDWDDWRRTALDYVDSGPVLDLGCGTGVLLDHLARTGVAAVGLDREPSMLGAARRRDHGLALVRGDAESLPFRDGAFAACLATFPAPFIREDACLREVARLLRPGGTFVVVVSGEWSCGRSRPHPARWLLRLFYGQGRTGARSEATLGRPGLPGRWERVPTRGGTALLWVARRQGD